MAWHAPYTLILFGVTWFFMEDYGILVLCRQNPGVDVKGCECPQDRYADAYVRLI